MAITLAEICDGVEATLGAAASLRSATSYDELTEGIATFDCPRIEVYPEKGVTDPSGTTDRTSFNACIQQSVITIHADLYARQRSQLGEDMKAIVDMLDELIPLLEAQERPPFFGVTGIKAFRWRWNRAIFKRAQAWYVGARFTIELKIF